MAKRKRLTPPLPLGEAAPLKTMGAQDLPRSYKSAPIAGVVGDASATAALDEIAYTLRQAREEGRMVLSLPLVSIQANYLMRDRMAVDLEGMDALKQSLRQRGQQAPIEVESLGGNQYGLISGWRRLQALRELRQEENQADKFETVLALLRTPEQSADAYLAMVEENEIRLGLSFYERARIASKAAQAGVFETEKAALQGLYQSVSRAKRSKIKSFIRIVDALDDELKYPEAISERLGLALAKELDEDSGLQDRLRERLRGIKAMDAETELACLTGAVQKPTGNTARKPKARMAAGGKKETGRGAPSELCPGLYLRANPDGSMTLHGPALDADLRARLKDWLLEQG